MTWDEINDRVLTSGIVTAIVGFWQSTVWPFRVLVFVLVALLIWLMREPSMRGDIISEALGMALTVTLVDSLVRWRETQRWLPAKHQLYSKLLKMTDDSLFALYPRRDRILLPEAVYVYGSASARVCRDPSAVADEGSDKDTDSRYHRSYDASRIAEIRRAMRWKMRFAVTLDSMAFMLDPAALALLQRLYDTFEFCGLRAHESADDALRWSSTLASDLMALREWLEAKADAVIPIERPQFEAPPDYADSSSQ